MFSSGADWNSGSTHREMRHRKMAFCRDTDYFPSHSVKVHSKCSIPLSTEWGHLVEVVGSTTRSISCWERRGWWRQSCPTFRISLLDWKIACPMSYIILTDIIQTVLETSECFLSNSNNNTHILAIRGRVGCSSLWARNSSKVKILPPILNKF
jgi:hypothetical protein